MVLLGPNLQRSGGAPERRRPAGQRQQRQGLDPRLDTCQLARRGSRGPRLSEVAVRLGRSGHGRLLLEPLRPDLRPAGQARLVSDRGRRLRQGHLEPRSRWDRVYGRCQRRSRSGRDQEGCRNVRRQGHSVRAVPRQRRLRAGPDLAARARHAGDDVGRAGVHLEVQPERGRSPGLRRLLSRARHQVDDSQSVGDRHARARSALRRRELRGADPHRL